MLDYFKNKAFVAFFFILLLWSNSGKGQEGIWWIASPEPRLNIPKYKLEFRVRTLDYILETKPDWGLGFQLCRWEAMAGRSFGKKFKAYLYLKDDRVGFEKDGQLTHINKVWGGLRGEFNTKLFDNKKGFLHLQYRYFKGYTPSSPNHQYFIYLAQYDLQPKLKIGLLGWAQHSFGETPYWFTGPSVVYVFNKTFSTLVSFDKDLFHPGLYLAFLRLNIVYTWKKD